MNDICNPGATFPLNPAQIAQFNLSTALLLPNTRAGMADVRSNTANMDIACIGDSTTFGVWSAGALTTGNMKPLAYPAQLSAMLNTSGTNSHANSAWGAGDTVGLAPDNFFNDSRLVIGNSWAVGFFSTLGGYYITASTATNSLAFTPTTNVDTFQFYYPQKTGGIFGTAQININGGTPVSVNQNAGSSVVTITKQSITGSLGSNTANILWSSGPGVFFTGINAYDSSKKWVAVHNCGWVGAKVADLVGAGANANGPLVALTALAPKLTIINCIINDWCAATPVATWAASMQLLITQALSTGDCLLVAPNPSEQGANNAPPLAVQKTYVTALYALAIQNNVAIADLFSRWVSYPYSNPLGFYGDGIHPNQVGYADEAQMLFNVIGNI